MSTAITKQCLQLFDDDNVQTTKHQKANGKKRSGQTPYSSGRREIHRKSKSANKSTIEEHRKKKVTDFTNESLLTLQKLSECGKPSSKITNTILEHNRGKLAKDNPIVAEKKETPTVFTDKDFEKFEKEFDFS